VTRENDNKRSKHVSAVEVAWIAIAIVIALIVVIAIYSGDIGSNTASNSPAVNSREITGSDASSTGVR
jgi:hypothetical protein